MKSDACSHVILTGQPVGGVFGNWKTTRRLGEGAFGAVYEAAHTSIAGRRAAVKVLHTHLCTVDKMKQRFINEAIAASRSEDEHIIRIFDAGIAIDGSCYMVMELLQGVPLSHLMRKGPMDPARTIHIGIQVACALGTAHRLNIVHRDLKPDNIFIQRHETERDFVKVLDFGVAKLRDDGSVGFDGEALTGVGVVVGTPGYMSPEQWRSAADIDGRADVYALGIILFRCLSGQLPFVGNTPYEWLRAHLEQPVPDLSELVNVTQDLSALIRRMLAKDREERPGSMREVIHELVRVREGSSRPLTSPPHAATVKVMQVADGVEDEASDTVPEQPRLAVARIPAVEVPARLGTPSDAPVTIDEEIELIEIGVAEELVAASDSREPTGNRTMGRGRILRTGALTMATMALAAGGVWLGWATMLVDTTTGPPPPVVKRPNTLEEAKEAMRSFDWKTAIALVDDGLRMDPTNVALAELRTRAAREQATGEALAQFRAAAREQKYERAVEVYGHIDENSVYYDQARVLWPEVKRQASIQGHLQKAGSPTGHGCRQSLVEIKEVLALDPRNATALKIRSACDVAARRKEPPSSRPERSEDILTKPVDDPNHPDPADAKESIERLVRRARKAYEAKQYGKAALHAREALAYGKDGEAWQLLGAASCHVHDLATALEAYDHVRTSRPACNFIRFACELGDIVIP